MQRAVKAQKMRAVEIQKKKTRCRESADALTGKRGVQVSIATAAKTCQGTVGLPH